MPPFEIKKIVTKKFQKDFTDIIFGTNKEIFQNLIKAFAQAGWNIRYVLPSVIFEKEPIDISKAIELIKNKNLIESVNFLTEDIVDEPKGPSKFDKNSTIMLAVSLILFIICGLVLYFAFFSSNKSFKEFSDNVNVPIESSESSQSSQ